MTHKVCRSGVQVHSSSFCSQLFYMAPTTCQSCQVRGESLSQVQGGRAMRLGLQGVKYVCKPCFNRAGEISKGRRTFHNLEIQPTATLTTLDAIIRTSRETLLFIYLGPCHTHCHLLKMPVTKLLVAPVSLVSHSHMPDPVLPMRGSTIPPFCSHTSRPSASH